MKVWLSLASMAALALASSPASAQVPNIDRLTNDAAAQVMHRLALCVGMRREAAGRILSTVPGSREESALVERLIDPVPPTCEVGGLLLEFSPRYLRGGIAEAVWHADFADASRPTKKLPLSIFEVPPADQVSVLNADQKGIIGLVVFAECTARTDRASVAALLATRYGSSAELSAYQSLQPAMENCLPDGMELKLTPLRLRGYLAEGAYRMAVSPGAAQ